MTSKRKAEIQRKLTLAAVPRPPEDLAERIKSDIPKYLNVEAERARFSRSVGFNLRIAASIIVMLSSLAAVLFLIVPDDAPITMTSLNAPRAKSAAPAATPVPAAPPAATEELRVEMVQETHASTATEPVRIADASAPAAPRLFAPEIRARRDADDGVSGGVEGGVVGGVAGGVVGGVAGGAPGGVVSGVASERENEVALISPAEAPVPPPAAMAPQSQSETAAARKSMSVTASAPSLMSEAYADELALTPTSVFGITVDPDVFRRIKTTIESGHRPTPSTVNVEALVNYFAGAPARRARRGVRLETEASPTPVGSNGHRGILRFTIDTASIAVPAGGTVPPIATDARLEIEFNRDAVERFVPIGDSPTSPQESALLHNLSVTGLYSLDLRTPLKATQRVATIRLHYRSIDDGKKHTITQEVRGSDLSKPWASASRRHRLASLGALWGESLRGSSGGSDVAKRAEELASQAPNDERARELKEVAVASSGGLMQ